MSIVLSASSQEVIEGIEHLLKLLLYPRLKTEQIGPVRNHISWMKMQQTNLNAQVDFETDPRTKSTKINFTISFDALQ